jgi:hypothetical protein
VWLAPAPHPDHRCISGFGRDQRSVVAKVKQGRIARARMPRRGWSDCAFAAIGAVSNSPGSSTGKTVYGVTLKIAEQKLMAVPPCV